MNVVYKVTYKPHIGTNFPKYYIGSKFRYSGNYFGSVATKHPFEYTEGLPLKDWWKSRSIEDFQFEIIEVVDCDDPVTLASRERQIQEDLGVLGNEYFNQALANEKFVSQPRQQYVKDIQSQSLKEFYQTPEGIEKRKRISERNKLIKKDNFKKLWDDPNFRARAAERQKAKKSSETRKRMSENSYKNRRLTVDGVEYISLTRASKELNVSTYYIKEWIKSGDGKFL